jgi:hypothetical protein
VQVRCTKVSTSVAASFQWVPVFSGCESSVGASLQWVPVFIKNKMTANRVYYVVEEKPQMCCVSVVREQTRREVSEDKFSVITCCEMEGHRHRFHCESIITSFEFQVCRKVCAQVRGCDLASNAKDSQLHRPVDASPLQLTHHPCTGTH